MAVTIFTKRGCPHCTQALTSLKKRGVSFEEINLTDNPQKINDLVRSARVRQVPVIIEDGKVTVGFNGGS